MYWQLQILYQRFSEVYIIFMGKIKGLSTNPWLICLDFLTIK